MTVAALPATISYIEDGVTTVFPVPYRFKAASDLVVDRVIGGGALPLQLGIDYSVTGGATDAGGTLTRTAATNGATLRIRRRTARSQPMIYDTGDRFPAKSHEEALDRGILIAQEQDDELADFDLRALKVPLGEQPSTIPGAADRAGRFLAFDGAGQPIAASGGGGDSGLRGDLARVDAGGSLVARNRIPAAFVTRTFTDTLDDLEINAFENFTSAQVAAARQGTAIPFLADAINEVLQQAAISKCAVRLSWGLYDLRSPLVVPPGVSLIGEGPSFSEPIYDPGMTRETGVVLYKNHGGDCVRVIGSGAYSVPGRIGGFAISGERSTPGNGLVVDQVGSLRIAEVRVFGVGGDGIILGVSPGDVTGQIHMTGIYVNNPGGVCIRNRSKWLKASRIETDGGQYSYYGADSPNADISQFHFEGASNKAVVFAGANGNSRLRGGFIGLTNPASLKGIELQSAAGNTDITIENVQIAGHGALTAAIEVNSSARRTRIHSCEIQGSSLGVLDASDGTSVCNTHFLACAMGISAQGDHSRYRGNLAAGTTGPCWLDHVSGGFGIWSDNVVDQPLRPTLYGGTIGNFGTNRVCNNSGYKTRTGGLTAGITSGTAIPHGLSVTPFITEVRRLGAPDPTALTWTYDATNIVPTWTGGGTIQFAWSARAVCEDA